MAYEVWSTVSRNLLATYETETEALTVIRTAVERHGVEYGLGLALGYENRRGRSRLIAEGEALVQRALSAAAVEGSPSPTSQTASA